jgi:hypothetical protein
MKKKKDEYLVYNNPNSNADFYYKNKQLHREMGPAIVVHKDKDKYSNLSDKKLYKRVTEPVVPETMITHIVQDYQNDIKFIKKPFVPYCSAYLLEGKDYEKQEFDAIILEKELSQVVPNNPIKVKKLKI